MQLTSMHYISLIVVLLLSFVPGLYISRKVSSADDYNVGGRSSGVALVAGGILSTAIGGAATVGTAQMAFNYGLCSLWLTIGIGSSLILMGLFYAKPLRNSGLTTISEFMAKSFGEKAGPITSLTASMGIFFSIVASSLTAFHLLAGLFHLSNLLTAGIIMAIVLASVFFGGINSSSMSGLFKIALLLGTLFVAGFMAYFSFGGLIGLHTQFPPFPWFSFWGRGKEAGLYSFFSVLVGIICTQSYIQAVFSAKNSKIAARGCILAGAIVIPVGVPAMFIGMFMRAAHPDILPIDALPLYFINYLPPWLGGAALTGIIISAIGSIAGLALGCGTMISNDVFGKMVGIKDSTKLLWINRFAVLIITFLSLVFLMYNLDSYVLTWTYFSMALRAAGIFLPLTFALIFKDRLSHFWGVLAMVAGIFVALTWKLFVPTAQYTLFQSLTANLIFLIPAVVFTKKYKRPKHLNLK